jgi:DNA integrity scanning protein DisA with diadenylate cyclase activity
MSVNRIFYVTDMAWYAPEAINNRTPNDEKYEIMIGCGGHQFAMRWYELSSEPWDARIEIFWDFWPELPNVQDLLEHLSAMENPAPIQVIALLKILGFKDTTMYTRGG